MKLEIAIQINESLLDGTYDHRDEIMEEALKLGIEALKRTQTRREHLSWKLEPLLPGETSPKPLHALGFNTGDDESP